MTCPHDGHSRARCSATDIGTALTIDRRAGAYLVLIDAPPTLPPSLFGLLGLSPDAWEQEQRRGAISARGYHFQDAVLTWLAVLGVTRAWPVDAVVPEGGDDARLLVDGMLVDVQVKSRQPHLATVGPAELAGWVAALAKPRRAVEGGITHDPAVRLMLVVEHGVPETGFEQVAAEVAPARALLHEGLREQMESAEIDVLLARLHLVAIRDPLDAAASALGATRVLNTAAARLAVQRLAAAMVACQDHNAQPGRIPAGLMLTDATSIVERAIELVDVGSLEQALRVGVCEAVEFTDPDRDARYLLGVATTPAHVAAGLVIERPGAVGEVVGALDAKRRVLVAGPSGAGKSAVAWLTVHATRHRVRWYRIRDLRSEGALAAIDRFARSIEASDAAPVGFVIDDLGHHGVAAWDALVAELSYRTGVFLLGTVREQDLHNVRTRPALQVVRPTLDEALAENLWNALRQRGQTSWPGWREPFEKADELVLEYTALLTTGERLETSLGAQVRALASAGEDQPLAVLAVVAVADLLGASLSVAQIALAADLDEAGARTSVARLRDEFLVREDGARVRGLHELRSRVASSLVHDITVRDLAETVAEILNVADIGDLDVAIRRSRSLTNDELILTAIAQRVRSSASAPTLAAALHGLQLIDYDRSAHEVADRLRNGLPPGEIARVLQTRFGANLHDSIVIDVNAVGLITDPGVELRTAFAASIELAHLDRFDGITEAGVLAAVLVGLEGVCDSASLVESVAALATSLTGGLDAFDELLDAARLHGVKIHASIIDALGGASVAAHAVAARARYALVPDKVSGPEVRLQLHGSTEVPFWAAGRPQGGLVQSLLAAVPDATGVRIDPVDDLDCTIPRLTALPRPQSVSAPTHAQRQREGEWQRALLGAVGLPLWSGRLEEETRLLPMIASTLDAYVRALCSCRAVPASIISRFQRLDQRARELPPPPAENESRQPVDGHVGAMHEADPFVTLLHDPLHLLVGAEPAIAAVTAFRLWRVASDLRNAGRWSLLPEVDDAVIDQVVELFYAIRVFEAERAVDRSAWTGLCARGAIVPTARRVELTLEYANEGAQRRLRRIQRRVQERLHETGFAAAQLTVTGTAEDGPAAVWPPGQIVAEIELQRAKDWPGLVDTLVAARAELVDEHRAMTALVSIGGRLSRHLSGEVAKAWWPSADFAALGRKPAPEPRGDAWRCGVSAAARIRATRRWAALGSVAGPMQGPIVTATDYVQHDLDEARRVLLTLGAQQAAATLYELASLDDLDLDLCSRARETVLALADADLVPQPV